MVIVQDADSKHVLECLGETRFMHNDDDNTSTIVTQPSFLNFTTTTNQTIYQPTIPNIQQISMELLTLDVRTLQTRCETQQTLLYNNTHMISALEEHNRLQNESIDALRKELLEHRSVLERQQDMINNLRNTIDQQQHTLTTQNEFSRLIASHVVDELLAVRMRDIH